jgi:hypothetical protein
MNRKQFLVSLAVLVVLAAAAAAVVLSDRSAWNTIEARTGQKIIPGLKIADVAEIAIRDSSGELHLARGPDGWEVRERADFPADTARIGELLVKLAESKAVQSEALPADDRARLELLEPKEKGAAGAGVVLELKGGKGALLGRLLLGKPIFNSAQLASLGGPRNEPTGRYVLAGEDVGTMLAVAEPFSQVQSKPQEWLVKDLLRVDIAKSIASTGKDGRRRWTVSRKSDGADWTFADSNGRPDLQKATDLASALGWIDLVDVVPDPAKADTGLAHGIAIKAETFDGVTYTVRIGNAAGPNYYVGFQIAGEAAETRVAAKGEKPEDKAKNDKAFEDRRKKLAEQVEREKRLSQWTYLVAKSSIEALLRDRAQLLPEKKKRAGKT